MAGSILGIGSTFYGKRDFREDGSYITTEWLIAVGIPLVPLRSFRVRRLGRRDHFRRGVISVKWGLLLVRWWDGEVRYELYEKHVPPNWKQVIYTYGLFALGPAWMWFLCSWCPSVFPHALDSTPGLSCLVVVSMIPALLPWILRYYARKKMRTLDSWLSRHPVDRPPAGDHAPLNEPAGQMKFWAEPEREQGAQDDTGVVDGAIADSAEAMELAAAYNNGGIEKYRNGDVAGAIADFTRSLQLKPDKAPLVYYNRGSAREVSGDVDGAIEDYTKAIELDPAHADAYNNRGYAKKGKGDLDRAIADLTKAIELKPDEVFVYYNRGFARRDKGDLDGAIADFTKVIELKPDEAMAYAHRGYAKKAKGDLGGANADQAKASELLRHPEIRLWI